MQSKTNYVFPFGQPVKLIEQKDRSPKRVFVLGVYGSAVHCKWLSSNGKTLVRALAVANEPYIFWRGDNVETIIKNIHIPQSLGALVPASSFYNGPSGRALDNLFLEPLSLSRTDIWLCDLVPHSCINQYQKKALDTHYQPFIETFGLPKVTLPLVPKQLSDEGRRKAICDELNQSQADTLILLGDQPIKWFLRFFDKSRKKLSDYGETLQQYGQLHPTEIAGKIYKILPLVHPRQAGKLGKHSVKWNMLHDNWIKTTSRTLTI